MGFDKIGPYAFSRSDLIATSLVISFGLGARRVRVMTGLRAIGGVAAAIGGILSGEIVVACGALGALAGILVIGPALRSRKASRNIYLSYEPEGLLAETDNVRTLYKWATVRAHRKIGSRLFIMISDGCALVVADRFTDAGNMDQLIATLAGRSA